MRYNYEDPNAIRYNTQSLLPNLVQVPKEAPTQFEKWLQDTGKAAGNWIQAQAVPQLALFVASDKTPADFAKVGGMKVLNNPAVANAIATFGATQFGSPIINGVKQIAASPVGKKIIEVADLFF